MIVRTAKLFCTFAFLLLFLSGGTTANAVTWTGPINSENNGGVVDNTASQPVITGFNVDYVFHTSAYGTLDTSPHSTTCSGSSGSNTLSCTAAPWPVGSWITILQQGTGPVCDDLYTHLTPASNPTYSCNLAPAASTLTLSKGTTNTGSSSYTYKVIPIDPLGGYGPASGTTTITNLPATLDGTGASGTTWVTISWSPATGSGTTESPWNAICRQTGTTWALIGVTDSNSFVDVGQPALTGSLLPSCSATLSLTNEALRAQITAISGSGPYSVTLSSSLNATITNATVVTDAAGGIQAAIDAAEAVGGSYSVSSIGGGSYSEVDLDPSAIYYTRTPIILGQNPNNLIINGRDAMIARSTIATFDSNGDLAGPALERADAASTNSVAQRVWIENLTVVGTGPTDSRVAEDGIWDGCASQGGGYRNVRIAQMPHRDYRANKGGTSSCAYFTKQVYDDFVLDGAGEMCGMFGFSSLSTLDDTYGHLFTRSCGQQLENTTGGSTMGPSFGATYFQVSNPQFSFMYTANEKHFENALMFYGSLGGHLGEVAFESTWPTGSASADLNITTSTGVTVDTVSCNDSGGSASSCLQTVNSHDITVHELNGVNGTRTLSCEWNNDSSGGLPNGENILIGMTWTGNNPTNAICTPGPMIVARSGELAVGDDVSNLAQGQIESGNAFVLKSHSAPASGTAGFAKLWYDSTNNSLEMYNGTSGPGYVGTGDAGSCTNSVVTAVNQGSTPTCATLSPSMAASGFSEWALSASGTYGALSSIGIIQCTTAHNSGHASKLWCVTPNGSGGCTTAPTVNVADLTNSTSGTALTCSTGTPNSEATAESLAFSAGDTVCLEVSSTGSSCSAPIFGVTAQFTEP